MLRKQIARCTPEFLKIAFHAVEAFCAALWYGFPGKKLFMIGVTGTKGKTSTAHLIWAVLSAGGHKTGLIGTADIKIGEHNEVNALHMTMPGPWVIQKLLRRMLDESCTHAVMEVTSEGLKQYRHLGVAFHIGIFTNLSPEHLASHGNDFEKYKETKVRLFKTLARVPGSISIINADSEFCRYYGSFPARKVLYYGIDSGEVRAHVLSEGERGIDFSVGMEQYHLRILGVFNIYNALPAIIVGRELGISYAKIREGLASIAVIPGRMEKIDEGQPYQVIVDYAHEKLSINTLLDAARGWVKNNGNIIAIIGAEGGGRDPAKREHMGRAAGTKADYVIVTTTDPYDDDPTMLAESVAHYVALSGKERGRTFFVIIDRREGIKKALSLAQSDDIVLITGMGAQETMIMGDRALAWNERAIVRELIKEKNKSL